MAETWEPYRLPQETEIVPERVIYAIILSENYFKLDQFSFNLEYCFRCTVFILVKNMNRTEHCQGYQFPGRKINNASRKVHSFLLKKFFYYYFKFESKCLLLWSLRFNKEISWKRTEGNTPKCKQRLALNDGITFSPYLNCFSEFLNCFIFNLFWKFSNS